MELDISDFGVSDRSVLVLISDDYADGGNEGVPLEWPDVEVYPDFTGGVHEAIALMRKDMVRVSPMYLDEEL